jgi:hypothetical protein
MVRIAPGGILDLEQTIEKTYFALRLLLVSLALFLPVLLWVGTGFTLKDSLSEYYCTRMRDSFVGMLCAVAASLLIHKGLSDIEDLLTDVAAFAAACTALFPITQPVPHTISAVTFFLAMALACWLCQEDSLKLGLIPADQIQMYRMKYNAIGIALVTIPLLTVAVGVRLVGRPFQSTLFWLESGAIWIFAYYWYIKSGELALALKQARERRG